MGSIVKTIGTGGNIRASEGAGTTTLTIADNPWQIFNISVSRVVQLPTTSVKAGHFIRLENRTLFRLEVQSSDGTTITLANMGAGSVGVPSIYKGYTELIALQDTPTAPGHWMVIEAVDYMTNTVTGTSADAGEDMIVYLNRNGRSVNAMFRIDSSIVLNTVALQFVALVPVGFRPTTESTPSWPLVWFDGSNYQTGTMDVTTNGLVEIYKTLTRGAWTIGNTLSSAAANVWQADYILWA